MCFWLRQVAALHVKNSKHFLDSQTSHISPRAAEVRVQTPRFARWPRLGSSSIASPVF